ncbi:MAG TPA: flavodoxin domain-containing protein, partial [Candidatus Bathyarchaeia archaeon]|nr:flavodoxin domain-containing protein [Candidatus Bathyarchaeia archaeon]
MEEPKRLERAIVIFDSKYGNTEGVAKSLADGFQKAGLETSCFNIKEVKTETLSSYDLIAVGAPTQAFSASKPMKDFLEQLENVEGLKGKQGFAFDTKLASRLSGSAGKYIENKLSKLGLEIAKPRESAIVKKSEGPLEEGEHESFERLGFEIGSNLT